VSAALFEFEETFLVMIQQL